MILRQDSDLRLHDDTSDLVGVGVGRRPAVLEVAVALGSDLTRDTDRRATVGNAVGELVDAASLVLAGEALLVLLAVDSNVLGVASAKLLNGSLNGLHAILQRKSDTAY